MWSVLSHLILLYGHSVHSSLNISHPLQHVCFQRQNKYIIVIKTVRDKHVMTRLHWVSALRMGVTDWRNCPRGAIVEKKAAGIGGRMQFHVIRIVWVERLLEIRS